MKTKETKDLCFKRVKDLKWKVTTCNQGEKCWCRCIEPVQTVVNNSGDKVYIAPPGSIAKDFAQEIVSNHNACIKIGIDEKNILCLNYILIDDPNNGNYCTGFSFSNEHTENKRQEIMQQAWIDQVGTPLKEFDEEQLMDKDIFYYIGSESRYIDLNALP
jgi:hypothetical protein